MAIKLFGFTFGDKEVVQVQNPSEASFALPTNAIDDGAVTNSQKFIDFVRDNGGIYGQIAEESDLFSLGQTICEGFAGGLSEDEITYVLAQALVNNDMGNDDGAEFGAALIVGAKNYLCESSTF